MASKAFHIELRVSNVDDPDKLKELHKALQECGQQLYAMTILICGETVEPEITLFGEDFAEGKVEIDLHDEGVQ
jgi:hypothetical protein